MGYHFIVILESLGYYYKKNRNNSCVDEKKEQLEKLHKNSKQKQKGCIALQLKVSMNYKAGDSMEEHISVYHNTVNQLTTTEIQLDDELQALLLLSSLPDS